MKRKKHGITGPRIKEPGIRQSEHGTLLPGNIAKRGVIGKISRKAISPLCVKLIPALLVAAGWTSVQAQEQRADTTITLQEAVVTGNRTLVNRNNVPMNITVVGREEIENSSESALLPVLSERVPGLFVSERGITGFGVASGAAGGISIRGIGGSPNTQMLVLIDGHPQFMGLMGHPLPDAYVASDVERVEVVRGPASILYGTNAMGGVINIITRKQNREGFSLNARAMGGSYNTQKYMTNIGARGKVMDAYVSVNHDRTDGDRANSAFHITNGFANVGFKLSEHFNLRTNVSIADYMAENPGAINKPMFDNTVDVLRGMASASLENHFRHTDGAIAFFYNWGDHNINDGYTTGGKPLNYRYRSKDDAYGLLFYQILRPWKGNMLTLGVDYKSYGGKAWNRFLNNNPDKIMVDTSSYDVGGYAIFQQNLFKDVLTLNAGGRLEHNKTFGNKWIPQVGLALRPTANSVIKTSFSKGFRNPTIREMFMWDPANPNLKPEEMTNYELVLEHYFFKRNLYVEVSGFIADGKNLIQTQIVNNKPLNVNSGKFKNKGIEVAMQADLSRKFSISGNYSWLYMKTPVLNAPERQLYANANFHSRKWQINVGYQYINGLYLATGKDAKQEDYGLLNAKVSYKIGKVMTLFAKGENLTREKYQILDGYPMPGAVFFGGVHFSIN